MPNKPKKEESYVQEEYYCEMCGRVSEEETELNEKTNKFLCAGCLTEQEGKQNEKYGRSYCFGSRTYAEVGFLKC